MSSIYNVILVIALGAQWICQGINVEQSVQRKVILVLPKTTPIPPQLAYYVQGKPSGAVYSKNEYFDKSAVPSNGGVLSVIGAPYSKKPLPPRLQNSNFGFVRNHKYTKSSSSHQPYTYQPIVNDPSGSYNFQQYYGQQNADSIVRATPPPERRPGRTPPPPSEKVTFQVNQLERNYRAQQDFERRNRDPHFRSQAIRQVQSPVLTTEAPQNHKILRNNIKQLKKSQKQHFNIDEDERPAHQSFNADDDDIEQITTRYETGPRYDYKNPNKYRDEESHDDRSTRGYTQHDEPSSNYEESEPKFTNFYDEIDEAAKYLSHADFVTPTTYQNYNNDHDDNNFERPNFSSKYQNYDDDNSDQPSSHYKNHDNNDDEDHETFDPYKRSNTDSYGRKKYITNEEVKQFDKYLRSNPRYVGPKKKQRIEIEDRSDRSDKGDDGDFVPYKMLASVRHSERYEHQPKDLANPLLKERILEKGGHVVYTEQGYEDKQFDHGNEEKFANIKHRRRRHVSEDKFPFYYSSTRNIPKYSAIRYAESGQQLINGKAPFYNTKRKFCDDVEFDDKNVNDKVVNFKSKKRLIGLEDKIDCLKEKLFGTEPLNNPIFQEQFVDETVPLVKTRRTRNSFTQEPYSTLANVFDDVTSNIEQSSKTSNIPSESKIDYVVFPPYVDLENSKMDSRNTSVLEIYT